MQELSEAQLEEAKSNISTVVVETDLETAEMRMTIDSQRVEIATYPLFINFFFFSGGGMISKISGSVDYFIF